MPAASPACVRKEIARMRAWMLAVEVSWRRVRLSEIIKVVVALRLYAARGLLPSI